MITIISPTTSNSMLNNGIFYDGKNFIDKYKNILSNNWVVNCFWTNQNSNYGCDIADLRTNKFCKDYNIENKRW